MKSVTSWLAVVALVAAACATEDVEPTQPSPPTPPEDTLDPGEVVLARADVPRITTPDISDAELEALVAGNTEFALELFRAVAEANTILSPYSAAAALTMTYAGARGVTADEMRETLRLGLPDERIHAARNQLDLLITTEPEPPDEGEPEPFTIRVANSLWGQHGYPFLDEFLTLLAGSYDAGMSLVDFVSAAEEARVAINDRVEDETEGRIVDLIPQGVIDELTRLVLVNAIWFKASWAEQFDPDLTNPEPFTLPDGSEVTVDMMRASQRLLYTDGSGYQAVRLPYAGDASMLVIVPDHGGLDDLVARLDTAELSAIRSGLSDHQVEVGMPRFEIRSQIGLKDVLAAMGMESAFTDPLHPDGADFTGITAERELYIQDVLQQAFITVDEEGTEAAAATAVVIGITSLPPPAELTIDRPFLFLIEHATTGEILFIGQVTDPTAG